MGNALQVRVERAEPLTAAERKTVDAWIGDLDRATGKGYRFMLNFDPGPEGQLLFHGYSYVRLEPGARLTRVLDQLTRLRGLLAYTRVDVGDDFGVVRWSEEKQRYVFELPRELTPKERAARDTERERQLAARTTLVKKLGVKRIGKYLYVAVGDPIEIRRSPREGTVGLSETLIKVMDTGVRREPGYLYILSDDGDLLRIAP